MRIALLASLTLACGTAAEPTANPPEGEGEAAAAADPAGPTDAAPDQAEWKTFGEPFTVAAAVPAAAVLGDPEAHASSPVRIEGELTEVCQKMGCWAVVRDDQGHSMRITMKAHGFGIDMDTVGRRCDVEGELVKKAVDPARLEHLASEGSTNAPEAGKAEAWELVASSVAVARK
jgi:hypothetical protein